MLVQLQTFNQKLFGQLTHAFVCNNRFDRLSFYLSKQFFLVFGPPRSVVRQHFVEYDSDRPNIGLKGVLILTQRLGSHVKWRSYVVFARF